MCKVSLFENVEVVRSVEEAPYNVAFAEAHGDWL